MKLSLVFFLGNEFYLSNNFVNFNSSAIIFRLVANVKDLIIFREWNTCAKSPIAQLVLLVVSTKMFKFSYSQLSNYQKRNVIRISDSDFPIEYL